MCFHIYLNVLSLSADGDGDVSSTCQVLEACMPGRYIYDM